MYQSIKNILPKHNTGVVLCFSKNILHDQNVLYKDLLSYKKLHYFAEHTKISHQLGISHLLSRKKAETFF